jgi:vitamin B12 transporter
MTYIIKVNSLNYTAHSPIFLLLCFLLNIYSAHAQEDSLKALPKLEVSSFRPNSFSIGQITIESTQTISGMTAQLPLQDWIALATPLSFRTYGTGTATISARGTGASHTALLWNGINIQNSLTGIVDLPIVEAGANDKIAVKLGAGTALFGSNAMGATIQLDNEKPRENGLNASLNMGRGSFDYQQLSTQFRYRKKFIAGVTRLSQQTADNDFSFRNTAIIGMPLQRAVNADFAHFNLTQHLYIDFAKAHALNIHFWHSQNHRALTPVMTATNTNEVLRDTSTRLVAEWIGGFGAFVVKARSAWTRDNNSYESDIIKNSKNKIENFIHEFEVNRAVSKYYELRFGSNATSERSLSNNLEGIPQRNRFAFFLNQNFNFSKRQKISLNIRQEISDKAALPLTFSVGAQQVLFPSSPNTYRLRGSFSRVYNLPAFNDLYWKNLGNRALQAERGYSRELGVSITKEKAKFRWHNDFTLFYLNLKNRILWLPENGIFRPNNLKKMYSYGIEYMGKIAWEKKAWLFELSPQYQLARSYEGSNSRKQLIYVPMHNANLTFSSTYRQFGLLWHQQFSSERNMTGSETTGAFALSNANCFYTIPLKKVKIRAGFKVNNIFNADYQMVQYYPNPRRNYKLELTLWTK